MNGKSARTGNADRQGADNRGRLGIQAEGLIGFQRGALDGGRDRVGNDVGAQRHSGRATAAGGNPEGQGVDARRIRCGQRDRACRVDVRTHEFFIDDVGAGGVGDDVRRQRQHSRACS